VVLFQSPARPVEMPSLGAGVILTGLAGVHQITLGQSEKGKGTLSWLVRFRKRNPLPPTALR
jgi:hypothetical protein